MRFVFALILSLCAVHAFAEPAARYVDRPEVQAFIAEMQARHGFPEEELRALFAQVERQESVLRAIVPQPVGERSWQRYRSNFVNARRIERGVEFWRAHRDILARAEAEYGVPAEIIVAILGVETQYGRTIGAYRVLDALTTLTFDYPRRAAYFRGELEELLLLARESQWSPTELTGSFAGAIGIPQFMPGSIRRFAVDYDDDGRRNLRDSTADAIGSVAHFLRLHGWASGEPVAATATLTDPRARTLIDGGVTPKQPVASLRLAGVAFDPDIPANLPAVLIELDSADAPSEYLVGLQNFYVITRYNRSSFYAAAVWLLARELKAAMARAPVNTVRNER